MTRIEVASPTDAPVLAAMSRDWIEHGLPWRWRTDAIERCMREPDTAVVVARGGGSGPMGFAVMRFDFDRRVAHLLLLAVAPAARRVGVASALLEWLLVIARRGGVERVQLEVRASSAGAQAFYASHGFRSGARVRGYYQGREDALRMALVLRERA